eukprot:c25072_g1_i1 orf=945-2615(-)
MASYAELRCSPASSTSSQIGPLASKGSQSSPSQIALHPKIGFPYMGTLRIEANVGFLPSCCALTVGLTEELAHVAAHDSPPSLPSASESAEGDLPSSQVEPANDEAEYIDSLAAEIQACSYAKDLDAGEEVHAHIISCGLDSDRYLGNLLVLMYGNCRSTKAAEAVFQKIPFPNIYSSNILINAYVHDDDLHKAKIAFDNMPQRNTASWNAIISALAKNGYGKDALHYYHRMLEEGFQLNVITFVSAIDACADATALAEGMKLHSSIGVCGYESDIIVGTALINMYGQCESLDSARDAFRRFPLHDVLSWSAMMAACVSNGCSEEALHMFHQMHIKGLKPSRSTFLAILHACGNLAYLFKGYEIHAYMLSDDIESDIIVENALINMYGKCRSLPDGAIIFCKMLQRNTITWSTMISAHADNNKNEEALELFYEMQAQSVNPNKFTFSTVFDVCASMQALEEGRCIHDYSVCTGIEIDFIMAIALINMYGKCGSLDDARAVFCSFEERGLDIWNTMISVCVSNGHIKEALWLFEEMQTEGVKPSKGTFKIIEGLSIQ